MLRVWAAAALAAVMGLATGCERGAVLAVGSCAVCKRPTHRESRAVASVDGKDRVLCCPACAFAAELQSKGHVRLREVTDQDDGSRLEASMAVFVVGGNEHTSCLRKQSMVDAVKHPYAPVYDRCSPAITAFASRAAALRHAATAGGKVMTYTQLVRSLEPR